MNNFITLKGVNTPIDTCAGRSFPIRLAAIDIGSNALRFAAYQCEDSKRLEILGQERYPLRLGHDVFLSGRMSDVTIESAVRGIAAFRAKIEELGVHEYSAVATSAVRESKNRNEFLQAIREKTGVKIQLITGTEEARLIFLAVNRAVDLGDETWMLVDLGGGSVEVSLVNRRGVLFSESHTMGSVRLLEVLTDAGDDPARFNRLLSEYVSTLRPPNWKGYKKPFGLIATGGNIESLADLGAASGTSTPGVLKVQDLQSVIKTLSMLSYNQRVSDLNLKTDRADVILPASLVYDRLARIAGAAEIIVPRVGIREGVVIDLLQNMFSSEIDRGSREREITEGAVALGRRYMFDENHARHVAVLAASLFDQLEDLHGFGSRERSILIAAAVLHDIGSYISYKRHHKHSYYIISNSELPGFSEHDMQLIANTARYHRKGEPSTRHYHFDELDDEERTLVRSLAAVLRLAEALDREHLQRVQRARVEFQGDRMVLHVKGEGDLLLEGWGVKKNARLFEDVYKVELQWYVSRG